MNVKQISHEAMKRTSIPGMYYTIYHYGSHLLLFENRLWQTFKKAPRSFKPRPPMSTAT